MNLLSQIVDKLESLEQEKEELNQYQKYDKERRALEYLLFDKNVKEAEEKLQQLRNQRDRQQSIKQEIRHRAESAAKKLAEGKRKLTDVNSRLTRMNDEKDQNSNEKEKVYEKLTRTKLEIDDLRLSVDEDVSAKDSAKKQHEALRRQIFEKRSELDALRPEYQDLITEEKKVEREKLRHERRRDELYAKQGRQNRFNDQDQRDQWLRGEIEKVNSQLRRAEADLKREEIDIQKIRRENNERNEAISACRGDMSFHKQAWDRQNQESLQMKRKKEDLVVKQNEFWRNETKLTHDKQQIASDLRNKESQLQGMIGRSTLNGINAIKEVRKRFQQQGKHDLVDGYLGTLIDCFSTEQSFFTAVEVTAGSRLFHHVVSTSGIINLIFCLFLSEYSAIGNAYLQEMNKMNLQGEVTFLPLDRLQARREDYPSAPDALPLIDKINYAEGEKFVLGYPDRK